MKKSPVFFIGIILFLALYQSGNSQTPLSYYIPASAKLNPDIPKPADILGYQVGEWHVSHDQIVQYYTKLAQVSKRIKYETYGKTNEDRPLTVAIISSESNISKIEELRKQHLQLSDPSVSSKIDIADLPVVVWLSHSIHGAEATGANGALLTAYYFAASTGKEVEDLLAKTIIIIDPATNPDGLHRFATWVNANKSRNPNTNPLSREHNEWWGGGGLNHYWFNLNRDWLPLEQPESESRIAKLLQWKPNVLVDQHEMGTNSTFHFSPGEPNRVNPLISAENQALTQKLADNYARAFDAIGSFYYSQQNFDDYYPGRGPTFLDLNGGVALLFEQASIRGFAQESDNGIITFPFGIRNQFTGSLSTVQTAFNLKNDFLNYQKNYYLSAIDDAKKSTQKGFIFGADYDHNTTYKFAEFLNKHGIRSYLLKRDFAGGKQTYKAGAAYVVPFDQPQYRLLQSIFEIRTAFKDSIFYDVSTWNIPLAYNLPFEAVISYTDITGDEFSKTQLPKGKVVGKGSAYAWILKWEDYNSPRALYRLLNEDIIVKVATEPVETLDGVKFNRGTVLIPLGTINVNKAKVDSIINVITKEDGIDAYLFNTGDNKKIDLGSGSFQRISKPKIAILTEEGVNASSAGELWHLFDTKYNIPATLLPVRLLRGAELEQFNILILPNGNYQSIEDKNAEKIKDWVAAGNTIIAFENAVNWLSNNKLISVELKKANPKPEGLDYEGTFLYNASRSNAGAVFEVKLDLTHPLAYGYRKDKLPLFKQNNIILEKAEDNALSYPVKYGKSPLLSGYSPDSFEKAISNTPALSVFALKRGKIIVFYNDLNFRGYWLGTNRLIANSLFFGDIIRLSAGFNRE